MVILFLNRLSKILKILIYCNKSSRICLLLIAVGGWGERDGFTEFVVIARNVLCLLNRCKKFCHNTISTASIIDWENELLAGKEEIEGVAILMQELHETKGKMDFVLPMLYQRLKPTGLIIQMQKTGRHQSTGLPSWHISLRKHLVQELSMARLCMNPIGWMMILIPIRLPQVIRRSNIMPLKGCPCIKLS